jgi:hypothetical protein
MAYQMFRLPFTLLCLAFLSLGSACASNDGSESPGETSGIPSERGQLLTPGGLLGAFEAVADEYERRDKVGMLSSDSAQGWAVTARARSQPGVRDLIRKIRAGADMDLLEELSDDVVRPYFDSFRPTLENLRSLVANGGDAVLSQLQSALDAQIRAASAADATNERSSHYCCWIVGDDQLSDPHPTPDICIGYNTLKAWAKTKCYASAAALVAYFPILKSGTCSSNGC